jgi:hypothetical protein
LFGNYLTSVLIFKLNGNIFYISYIAMEQMTVLH